jgi:hypothetical protein
VISPTPGIADVVSENTFAGSRPETKVPEQRTLATKPVATLGTSRARAADSASALSAVVAARMTMRRRLIMVCSGMAHLLCVPAIKLVRLSQARRIRKSSGRKPKAAGRF